MNLWTWVLIGLCAAGVLLVLASAIAVLRIALRLRNRLNDLQNARLFTALESLELQNARLQHLSAQAAPLAQRAQTAVQRIRVSFSGQSYAQIRESLQSTGAAVRDLFADLR